MDILTEMSEKGIKAAIANHEGKLLGSTLPLKERDGEVLLSAVRVGDLLGKRVGEWNEIELKTTNGYALLLKGKYIVLLWARDNSYKAMMREYAEKIFRL